MPSWINTPVHIICGRCGCSTLMKYKTSYEFIEDNVEEDNIHIYFICENCGTLTGIDEVLDETTSSKGHRFVEAYEEHKKGKK